MEVAAPRVTCIPVGVVEGVGAAALLQELGQKYIKDDEHHLFMENIRKKMPEKSDPKTKKFTVH